MAANGLFLQDSNLIATGVLPVGGSAGATTATTLIDLEQSSKGNFIPERVEFQLQIPVLTTTQLPNSTALSYQILATDAGTTNSASAIAIITVPATTAAVSGGGAAAYNYNFKLPCSVNRYLFAQATGSASTSAGSVLMNLVALF